MGGRLTFLRANLRFYPIKRKEWKSVSFLAQKKASVGVAVELLLRAPQGVSGRQWRSGSPEKALRS
jgi:hypothetical protein